MTREHLTVLPTIVKGRRWLILGKRGSPGSLSQQCQTANHPTPFFKYLISPIFRTHAKDTISTCRTPITTIGPSLVPFSSLYAPSKLLSTQSLIRTLNLTPHIEGGYFVKIDRDPLQIPNLFLPVPYQDQPPRTTEGTQTATPNASTTIFYLLTPIPLPAVS